MVATTRPHRFRLPGRRSGDADLAGQIGPFASGSINAANHFNQHEHDDHDIASRGWISSATGLGPVR